MSNITTIQRKNEALALLENKEIQERLCALCGNEASKDKFKASLLNIALDSNLSACSMQSIVKASLDIAGLKLSLNKNLGKAYIVPRKVKIGNDYITEARIDIGYKGWLELAKRSKLSVKAHSVFDCDDFVYSVDGVDEYMKLTPNFELRQEHDSAWVKEHLKGIVVGIKDLKSGDSEVKFVSKGTLLKIMQKNDSVKNGKYSAYTDWLHEMLLAKAIKSCLSKTAMSEDTFYLIISNNKLFI
ncbi:recombinase RecT [Helicobacter trogontum]|uniref:Recombinase RecT n=1 Tax=Helicobacter trogontum TaxID=50960 RepID=A0A4U8S990_9HELI|nr:recombinase RecT [Helicobacter trogontum]TLD82501.1 hypothetical protein LS81_007875 [Helicobacter trogontum]